MATRIASGKTIQVLGARLPEMMGGSADLDPSTHTHISGAGNFEPENWAGRNMHFGIREHAMGAILNGMALHRGLIPYGGTFLIFSDYMRPPAGGTIGGIAIDPWNGCAAAGGRQ
jgi:transketolase